MYLSKDNIFEDDNTQKELFNNNYEKNLLQLKVINKKKSAKQNNNIGLLPKLKNQENIINLLKQERLKSTLGRSSSDAFINKKKKILDMKEKDEEYKEELLIINKLWEELGVTQIYQEQFNNLLIYDNIRKIMIFKEKENLQKVRNALMKLRKEIINRENNINSLVKMTKIIENEDLKDNLLKEIVKIIKSLRLNAVNIVLYMVKFRELGFYYYFQGKWDLTKIKKDYLFNNRYLIKMKNDLYFLSNSILNKYIEMNNNPIDSFLTNCSQRNDNSQNENKIIIPITDELSQLIEQCRFVIIQDFILDNIYNNNYDNYNDRVNSGKTQLRKNSARSHRHHNQAMINNYFHNINISKTIHLLKNDNFIGYNDLFINNHSRNNNQKKTRKIFDSKRLNINCKDKKKINNFICGYDTKRIIIEHDTIDSLNKKEFTNNKNFMSSDNIENNTNINNKNKMSKDNFFGDLTLNEILKENEELKKDNEKIKKELLNTVKKMEKSDKLRKKLENELEKQKKEMEKVSNSVEEIKQKLINEKKELENQLNEEKLKNKETEILNEEKGMNSKKQNQITINKEIEMEIIKNESISMNDNETNQKKESIKEKKA